MSLDSIVLPADSGPLKIIPDPEAKPSIASPRIVELEPVTVSPSAAPPGWPASSTSGVPAYPGCENPSIKTASVIAGNSVAGQIVCTEPPGMSKAIVSRPGALLASRIAWRSEPGPESAVLVTRHGP